MEKKELSFVISNPTEGQFLKAIDWNKEEFKELVASITEQYQGVTYTDEQMKLAKDDRARLNAMKKAISDRRIEIKKTIMEPYTQFENEVKEIVTLIEEPIGMIDSQIKEYEEKKKEEKKQTLNEYFQEEVGELESSVTFDMIFDAQYLTTKYSIKKAKEEIKGKLEKMKTDIRAIESMVPEKYRPAAKDVLERTMDLSQALSEARRLKELDKKAEEERLRREEELERQQEMVEAQKEEPSEPEVPENVEPIQKAEQEVKTEPEYEAPVDPFADQSAPQEPEKICKASFTIYGTKTQIMQVKEFMLQNNIKFGKVEK